MSSRVHPEERASGGSATSLGTPLIGRQEDASKKKSVFFLQDAAEAAGKGFQTAFGALERGAGQAAEGVRKGAEAVAKTATQGAEAVAKTATEGAEAFSRTASDGAKTSAQSVIRAQSLAKRVEQLARQQALVHLSTGFKLLLFFAINASLMVWLFVLARFTSRYLAADEGFGTVSTTYATTLVQSSTHIRLSVNDYYVPQPLFSSSNGITFLIHLPQDSVGDPGWNFQDITNATRTFDQPLTYFHVTTGKRMIQNYRRCRTRCLTGDLPADFVAQARNYSATAYGFSTFDFYLDRDWFISTVDPDFFAMYHSPDMSSVVREAHGRWGQTAPSNDVGLTKPTDSKFVCNFGSPRRRLTAIVIRTSACHVQITSHAGSDYSLLVRGRQGRLSVPSITETVTSNSTSGCQTFELTIDVRGDSCPTSSVPGIKPSCEDICALVLQKGESARRLPIRVVADVDTAVDPSVLYIDDRFLVLDSRHPWTKAPSTTPDLSVLGGSIVVDLRYARIGNLLLQAGAGRKAASFLSVDTLYVNSTFDDDVVLEDNRNSLLMYRNPDNLVCAAAPLVEQIPQDFLECDALAPGFEVHKFYEVSVDGVIDKREFLLGLSRLGISFESLGFTDQEKQAVMDHVFNAPDPTQQLQDLPPREAVQRLYNLLPPLLTLYDTGDAVELSTTTTPRAICNANCLAAGNSTQYCNAACVWRCNGASLNISEPSYGLCDPSAGCAKTCGVPDWPITRYSSVLTGVSQLPTEMFDVDANGLMGVEELRSLLLRLHSNCTYKVLQTDVRVSTSARYCAVQGEGQYTPGVVESYTALYLNCNYTNGNSDDWRINNLQAVPGVSPAQYGSTRLPRECRPFPDYDPRLSGRQYDPSAKRSRCPECFMMDGTRVPPEYYNRSTWSRERYEEVMAYVHQVFTPRDVAGAYVPYFNLSDDTQFYIFAHKLLATQKKSDRVDYNTFNLNIQTLKDLDFLGQKYLLFNPWCFNGLFLKIKPDYVSGDFNANQAAIVSASMRHSDTGSNLILSTNMPGYNMSTSPSAKGTLPCSAEWGNGTQASTNFTYYAWANSSIGYKWGKALPEFCMDERWPDGGINGRYPNDWSIYGSMAGQRIIPGCEVSTCLPHYWVENGFGSIHAQVLPFTGLPEPPGVDWWNETGSYRRMVDNCVGEDGTRKCFYQGYSDDIAGRFSPTVLPSYHTAMQPCVDQSADCSDQLVVLSVTGEGVPTHQKWFWVSRKVYMEVEPPFFYIMSAGTLSPDIKRLKMRMTPGFCSVAHGAVEAIDWRDSRLVGSNADTHQALRTERNAAIYRTLVDSLPAPTSGSGMSSNTGWYLKQIWRDPFTNESLFMDPATADALRDTAPGYTDPATGQKLGVGAFWRHRRACYGTGDCSERFFTYRDNCLVPRFASLNASNASWYLSPCSYPNGSSAYLDPAQAERGGTFNETDYSNQFAMNITDYKWLDHVGHMTAEDHLMRNFYLYTQGYSADNVTVYAYSKLSVSFNDQLSVQFNDASGGAGDDTALLLSIIFSILIAATCGLGALAAIAFFGFRYLAMLNRNQEMQRKVRQQRIAERHDGLFDAIAEKKAELVAKYRRRIKEKTLKAAALQGTQLQGRSPAEIEAPEKEPTGASGRTGSKEVMGSKTEVDARRPKGASGGGREEEEEDGPDREWLSEEEKKEILYVMAQSDFTDENVHRWNLHDMAKIWREEVKRRKPNLRKEMDPVDRCTLLEANRLEDGEEEEDGAEGDEQGHWWHRLAFWRKSERKLEDVGKSAALKQAEKAARAKQKEEARLKKEAEERETERRIMMSGNFVQRMSFANILRMRRAIRFVAKIFSHSFPSPLKVLDQVVVNEVRIRLFNSLHTFLKVKCKVNHQLQDREEIVLGMLNSAEERMVDIEAEKVANAVRAEVKLIQAEIRRRQEEAQGAEAEISGPSVMDDLSRLFTSVASAKGRPVAEGREGAEGGEGTEAAQCAKGEATRPTHSVGSGGKLDAQGGQGGQPGAQGQGKGHVGQVSYADGLGAGGEGDDDDDNANDGDEEVFHFEIDGTGEGAVCVKSEDFRTELYAVKSVHISVHKIQLEESEETGAMAVAEGVGKMVSGLVRRLFNMLSSTVTGKVDSEKDVAYVVVVQEGPGCVVNKEYEREEDEKTAASPDLNTDDSNSTDSDSGDFWVSRTLVLPCPALPTRDGKRAQGVTRTYMINEVNGPSYVTINTSGSDALEDHNPIVEFHTTRRGFNTIYERWCAQNGLIMREVLDEEGFLGDVNIQIKKRVVPRIKGLRLLSSTLRATVERHTQQQDAIGAIQQLQRTKTELGLPDDESTHEEGIGKIRALIAAHRLFERGEDNQFSIRAADVGTIQRVRVRLNGVGLGAPWHLASVALCSSATGQYVLFPCNEWISEQHGLQKDFTSKEQQELTMDAGELFAGVSKPYTVTVYTSDLPNAGTNAEISIQLFGDRAYTRPTPLRRSQDDFQRSSEDAFVVHGPDIGRLRRIVITSSEYDLAFAWHLDRVEVQHPGISEPYVFHCNEWLAVDLNSSGPIRREYSVQGGHGHHSGKSTYKIMVRTGDTAGAGTDSKVWVTIYGDKGDTGELELKLECEDVEEDLAMARPVTREAHLRSSASKRDMGAAAAGGVGGVPGSVELSRESVSSRQGARNRDKAKMDKLKKMVMKQDAPRHHGGGSPVRISNKDSQGGSTHRLAAASASGASGVDLSGPSMRAKSKSPLPAARPLATGNGKATELEMTSIPRFNSESRGLEWSLAGSLAPAMSTIGANSTFNGAETGAGGAYGTQAAEGGAGAAPAPAGPEHNPIFEALMRSQEPFARFLRLECELTANFASDWVDLEALNFRYNSWLRHQRFEEETHKYQRQYQTLEASVKAGQTTAAAAPQASVPTPHSLAGDTGSGAQAGSAGALGTARAEGGGLQSGGSGRNLSVDVPAVVLPSPGSPNLQASPFLSPPQPKILQTLHAGGGAAATDSSADLLQLLDIHPKGGVMDSVGGSGPAVALRAVSGDGAAAAPGSDEVLRLGQVGEEAQGSTQGSAHGGGGRNPTSMTSGGRGGGADHMDHGFSPRGSVGSFAAHDILGSFAGRGSGGSRDAVAAVPGPVAEGTEERPVGQAPSPDKGELGRGEVSSLQPQVSQQQLFGVAPADDHFESITPEAVDKYGLKYADEDVYELVGVIVDLKDLLDDPDDANRLLTLALDAITVTLHTAFIWVLAVPLVLTFVGFQQVYEETTGIEHLLTIDAIRLDPTLISQLYLFPFLKNILIFALAWIMFCYVFLIIHYVFGPDGRNATWHIVLRSIFWLYLTVMVAILVAYVFEIITWIILGAVINPNKYLPYSVAIITLLAHTHATYMRLKKEFAAFRDKVTQVVMEAFIQKLRAAIEVAQKAVGTVASSVGGAASKWQAEVMGSGVVQGGMDAVQAFGNYPGAPGGPGGGARSGFLDTLARIPGAPGPKGSDDDGPPAALNSWGGSISNMLRGQHGYQKLSNVDDAPLPGFGPGAAHGPAMRLGSPSTDPHLHGHAEQQLTGQQHLQHASAAGMQAAAPYLPQQYQQYWAQAPGALNAASAAYANRGAVPLSYPQAATAMASFLPSSLPGGPSAYPGGSPGELKPMNPYEIFKLYAKDDDSLDYNGFGRLLDHLEIKLIGDKRRELFVRFTSKDRHTMGYKEFEACYAVIKETIVLKTLADNGMTRGRFIFMLCYAVFILLLIFVFIFVGVAAFTGAGTLGAIVNSLLAAGSGIALNLKKKDEAEESAPVSVKIGDQEYTGGGGNETTVTTAA